MASGRLDPGEEIPERWPTPTRPRTPAVTEPAEPKGRLVTVPGSVDAAAKAEKERFRNFAPELGLLLWAVWNPVGVDAPVNEYDGYAPRIWKLLADDAGVEAVEAALNQAAEERIGGGSEQSSSRAAAQKLTEWWYWRFDYPREMESETVG